MATIPFEVTWMYQVNEEILETRYWYVADEVIEADKSQDVCEDLADFMYGVRADFAGILPTDCRVWGVSAKSPLWQNVGPARKDRQMSLPGTYLGASLTDQVTYRIYIHSHDVLNMPIRNSLELSGVPVGEINCNLLEADFVTAVNSAIANFMPLTIALSSADVELAVRHKPGATPVDWFLAESRNCGDMVGSNITRRGNKAQRGPDTKPAV